MVFLRAAFAVTCCLLPLFVAQAQGTVQQSGAITVGHLPMYIGNGRVMDAGGPTAVNGATPNSTLAGTRPTGIGIVNGGQGIALYSGYANAAYSEFKLGFDGAGNALMTIGRVGGGSIGSCTLRFNAVDYSCILGGGNVAGPNSSTVNEIASWNATTGNLLRQGAAGVTDNRTSSITTTGAALAAFTRPGQTAEDILQRVSGFGGYIQYDAVRGVAVQATGSTVVNTTGIAGYVRNQVASTGPGQNAAGVFGVVTCEVDNSSCWGINTILMDSDTYAPVVHGVRGLVNELDFNVTSTNTVVQGLWLIGASVAQPGAANAVLCSPLSDPNGVVVNPIHWTSCFITENGAAPFGLALGAVARSGTSVASQQIRMNYFDTGSALQTATLAVSPGAPPSLSLDTTAASLGFSVKGDIFQTTASATHWMGASSKAAMTTDASDNLSMGSGAWNTVIVGNTAAPATIVGTNITLSPSGNTNAVIVGQRLKLQSWTVATLPTCNAGAAGSIVWATDSNAATFNAIIAGGGGNGVLAGCDGTNWRIH